MCIYNKKVCVYNKKVCVYICVCVCVCEGYLDKYISATTWPLQTKNS